jgi:protein-S-isoprenylcysteine O-methyltransferase Ste14
MRNLLVLVIAVAIYSLIALPCLGYELIFLPNGQPNQIIIIGFLLSLLWAIKQVHYGISLSGSKATFEEGFGLSFDPAMTKWTIFLLFIEFLAFLDYGHLRLLGIHSDKTFQIIGIIIFIIGLMWLTWVDLYLARHFSSVEREQNIIDNGPFKYIRHPRYTGMVLTKIAFALVFTSFISIVLAVMWLSILSRRTIMEELHLKKLFGESYSNYMRKTWRLLPGIF